MNFLKLASKASQLGSVAAKHLGNADKLLSMAQKQADKHLQGTDLHRKLSTKLNVAKGHVNTAKTLNTRLQTSIKKGGRKRKRTTSRKSRSSVRKSSKKRRRKSGRSGSSRRKSRH